MQKILLLLIFLSFISAKEEALQKFNENNERIFELFADNIDAIDFTTAIATGNAVIVSQDVYIVADYIKYNTKTREAEASGNVKIYRNGSLFFTTQKAKVEFDEKHYLIEPFYMQDSTSGMWISAKSAQNEDKNYEFSNIIVSGCDVDSPIWHIEGSSGSYNQDNSIASIWNPRIYIKNIPMMYLPYLFFSTKNKRTTGLLYPEFASSSIEGLIYLQPFFIALQDFWDMTLSPQIRWRRGFGLNSEVRVVDTNNKTFTLNAGIFYNYKKYIKKYNVKNQYIFGFDFNHERGNLLNDVLGIDSDGLYMDFRYMNDLDYIRLQSTNNTDIENKIQISKANYFGYKDNHFLGLSFKYFLDLSKVSNDDTFQTIPQVQYHKHLEQIYINNLLYSVDVKSKNIMRNKGFGYFDNSLKIPLYISTPILSGYFLVGANAELNAGVITLNKTNTINGKLSGKNSTYFSTNYGFFINSDIAKQYDKIFHTMSFSTNFSSPFYRYYKDDNNIFSPQDSKIEDIRNGFSNINILSQSKEQVQLKFSQYFFGLDGIELLYHRMSQDINLFNKGNILGSLKNELGITPISNIDLNSTIYYSHKDKKIEEASISLNAYYALFRGALTYFFKKNYDELDPSRKAEKSANFLRIKLSQDFGYFTLTGNAGYDFEKKYVRDWDIAIYRDVRCFGIGLRFANEIVPILTNSGSRTITNNFVSLELRFVPITSTSVSYRFKER